MGQTSEALLKLKPVRFRYKDDDQATPPFGLIAEEIAKANPDLVLRDENSEIYTVRDDAVNAMLLNEFLKEHRNAQELRATVTKQEQTIAQQKNDFEARVARQQEEINTPAASINDQGATIQKVSTQLEINKASRLMVDENDEVGQRVNDS